MLLGIHVIEPSSILKATLAYHLSYGQNIDLLINFRSIVHWAKKEEKIKIRKWLVHSFADLYVCLHNCGLL